MAKTSGGNKCKNCLKLDDHVGGEENSLSAACQYMNK